MCRAPGPNALPARAITEPPTRQGWPVALIPVVVQRDHGPTRLMSRIRELLVYPAAVILSCFQVRSAKTFNTCFPDTVIEVDEIADLLTDPPEAVTLGPTVRG